MSPLTTIACIVGAAVLGFVLGVWCQERDMRDKRAAEEQIFRQQADKLAEERGKFWMSSEVIRIRARFLQEAIEEWES